MRHFVIIITLCLAFSSIVHAQTDQSQSLKTDNRISDTFDGDRELDLETETEACGEACGMEFEEEYLNNEEHPLEQEFMLPQDDIVDDSNKVLVKVEEDREEKFLPPVVPLPGREGEPVYTLVLDMDETLIHYEYFSDPQVLHIRPHARKFLEEMAEYYEIVVFTGGIQEYADGVLDELDPSGYISYRLYRQHTITDPKVPNVFIKDLDKIGRDLSKTLIVDNTPQNFKLQVENGLPILSYYGEDDNDNEFPKLMPFLKSLVEEQIPDVRMEIKKYREQQGI